MIEKTEIVSTLASLNGGFFNISNLNDYAKKIVTLGKSIEYRCENTKKLISYVLFYDNGPDIFISMVWTGSEYQGKGYAKALIKQLINSDHRDIKLEVHRDNPAVHMYKSLGFVFTDIQNDIREMCLKKRIAIMQPYIFPYIGYFHLVDASNLFVFYDDVNYITDGWINRNRILSNDRDFLFSIPISKASHNKLINETVILADEKWKRKLNRTINQSYRKAPYFQEVMPFIESVFLETKNDSISSLAISSISSVFSYLGMPFNYTKSSICSPETKKVKKEERLFEIIKNQGYKRYVNSAGGVKLYSKEYFSTNGIELSFVKSLPVRYEQYSNAFIPWLSIIDVLMFNSPETIKRFLKLYELT